MKYVKLKGRIPKKRILSMLTYSPTAPEGYHYKYASDCLGWIQKSMPSTTPDYDRQTLYKTIAKLLDIDVSKIDNLILHFISKDSVQPHTDNMSTGVYLIPIKVGSKTLFHDHEYGQSKPFKPGYAIKFNDHNTHWLETHAKGYDIVLSVDTNPM